MTTPRELGEAIDTVARAYLCKAVQDVVDLARIGWEDFPELAEDDFVRVQVRALDIVQSMEHGETVYEDAYRLLSARATEEV
jgi:hypothetical protein